MRACRIRLLQPELMSTRFNTAALGLLEEGPRKGTAASSSPWRSTPLTWLLLLRASVLLVRRRARLFLRTPKDKWKEGTSVNDNVNDTGPAAALRLTDQLPIQGLTAGIRDVTTG